MEFCVDSIYRLPFSFQNQEKWQEDTSTLVEEEVIEAHQLIVYNDEVNTRHNKRSNVPYRYILEENAA
jgi:hypothetical protein